VNGMDYTMIEELLNSDTLRINIDLPKKHLERLDNYVKINMINNRKKLLEMLIIKFVIEHTEEVL
jgi:metal-responsive CopG/Arc/MetJ family transcriptional regulator